MSPFIFFISLFGALIIVNILITFLNERYIKRYFRNKKIQGGQKMISNYEVEYNIYRVKDRLLEAGIDDDLPASTGWEYEVTLLKNSKEISSWDSWFETYSGGRHLSYRDAKRACLEIKKDVEKLGKVNDWFRI